jgi:hypothetical protein
MGRRDGPLRRAAQYGEVLRTLTGTIASDRGSRPNGDVLATTGAAL